MKAIAKAPDASPRLGRRDHEAWLPRRRRDDWSPPVETGGDPRFMTATLAAPSQTFVQVTLAVVGPAAVVSDERRFVDVTGEVIAKGAGEPQPASRRADATFHPPAAAVVARYLANVESGPSPSRRSVYA